MLEGGKLDGSSGGNKGSDNNNGGGAGFKKFVRGKMGTGERSGKRVSRNKAQKT